MEQEPTYNNESAPGITDILNADKTIWHTINENCQLQAKSSHQDKPMDAHITSTLSSHKINTMLAIQAHVPHKHKTPSTASHKHQDGCTNPEHAKRRRLSTPINNTDLEKAATISQQAERSQTSRRMHQPRECARLPINCL